MTSFELPDIAVPKPRVYLGLFTYIKYYNFLKLKLVGDAL